MIPRMGFSFHSAKVIIIFGLEAHEVDKTPFGLVDMLISLAVLFLVIGVEFLIIFYLFFFSAEIVVIENNIAVIIGIMHFL